MLARTSVLVTGGTGVLGGALVAELCAANYAVVANYYHDEERARELQKRTGCQLARADVRDENAVQSLFETHKFDAIIHAAGVNRDALLLRTSETLWREQLRANLDSAFLITRAALQFLPDGGRLILISSRVGERGFIGQSAYAASKGAITGLMRAAAAEGRARDLKINALCPGFAPSTLSRDLSDKMREKRTAENLISAADAAQSLAATCRWLLRARVSGRVIRADCRV